MRNISLDLLKVLLAFFVMLIHLKFLSTYYPEISYFLVNGIFRVAVPTFLVINGYFLYHIIGTDKFRLQIKKLLILYIAWMIVYAKFWAINNNTIELILTIFFGYHILWYISGLILSAIMLNCMRQLKPTHLLYISITLLVIGFFIQKAINAPEINIETDSELAKIVLYRNFIFDCFPFLCVGYLINRCNIVERMHKINTPVIMLALVLSISTFAFETWSNLSVYGEDKPIDLFISALPLSSILFFIFIRTTIIGRTKIMSNFATAIFFTHLLCIIIARKILSIIHMENEAIIYMLTFTLTTIASISLAKIKNRHKNMPLL
ncbi:TPA: acyltransferase family protein [Klebsiella pneumoniae]